MKLSSEKMKVHNPLPQSLEEDIKKCAYILSKFTKKEIKSNAKFQEFADKGSPLLVI